MKKVLLSILLMLLPILASAETVEIDGIWYNIVTKIKEAEVIRNPNFDRGAGTYSGSIEIPTSVTYNDIKYSVTSIGDEAFSYCTRLTSATIPNSITSIGESAFYYCNHLPSITIPNSVTSIGGYAFSECSGLTSVHISSLEAWFNISIMSNPLDYAHHLFLNGEEVKDLIIPQSVTSIGRSSFSGCSGLTSVTIPSSVTSIGLGAFAGCSGLTSITIPNSVTSIDIMAFQGCTGLTSVTIPNSVTSLGEWAFQGCSGLTSITIGSRVKLINYQTFANCSELSDVYCLAGILGSDKWSGEVLYTDPDAFKDSYIEYATLHVPAASIEAYRTKEPWSQFKAIVALEDGDNPEIKKCATPEISYANGKVSLSCETEGVEFISEVTVDDAKKYYDSEYTLSQTYKITVYATKAGYEDSDVATREIVIENGQTSLFGDLNKDGKVNVADHVKLSDIIMNK